MDEIQKILIKAGRKDLAQKYYVEAFLKKAIYFGKGYEKEIVAELEKILPDYVVVPGKMITIMKGGKRLAEIEIGPMPGYKYAKLSFFDGNMVTGSVSVEKVMDVKEYMKDNDKRKIGCKNTF